MTQVFDESTGQTIVRSSLRTPVEAEGNSLNETIVRVENFLAGENPAPIEFVLDERFRERAFQVLLDRSILGSVGIPVRDLANFISVDGRSETAVYITALMKSRVFNPRATNKIIDRQFRELV